MLPVWLKWILIVAQTLSALLLVVLVLIHSPKGDGLGGIGGAAQVFTSQKGADSALIKTTGWAATVFLTTSFLLGYYW